MLVENYKQINKMNDTKFREYSEDPDNCPEDFPKRKTGLFSSEIIITEKMEEEMKVIDAEIDKLTANVSEDNTDTDSKRGNFTGIVFVVLKTQKDMYKVLNGQPSSYSRVWNYLTFCCRDKSDFWYFERAPEPSDIYWENLGTWQIERVVYGFFSYFMTGILMGICLGIIFTVKTAQMEYIDKIEKEAEKSGEELSFY